MTDQAMREAFEAQMRKQAPTWDDVLLLGRMADGERYASLITQNCWLAWQAALSQKVEAPSLERFKAVCPELAKPGGCQRHNLQCGYPKCNELASPKEKL